MSVQELLSLILGSGNSGESVTVTAQRLLSQFEGAKGIGAASLEELTRVKGIGPAKASTIIAAFELADRAEKQQNNDAKPIVKTPEEVFREVKSKLKDKKKEYFLALLLDTRNRMIKNAEISIGSLDSSIVHPREVFKEALSVSAASVIFVHNHPSGDTQPSEDDIKLTKRLVEAGDVMGITVLDHVITGDGKFLSLKRQGLL